MVNLPKFTIAAKLYAIFALLATATVVLSLTAVISARHHAALTDQFEAALHGSQNIQKIDGLIYAVVMESRGVYMSTEPAAVKKYADGLLRFNSAIGDVLDKWKPSVLAADKAQFQVLWDRVKQFRSFRRELVRRAIEVSPAAGREWGDNDANRDVRKALNKDLEAFTALYAKRAGDAYAEIDRGIETTAWIMMVFGAVAVLLAGFGAVLIHRSVARPLAEITRVTETVAEGQTVAIPYGARRDEIGALSRSIAVFQRAIHANKELNQTVQAEADARKGRHDRMSAEIARFSAEVETGIAELGAICDQMLHASSRLTGVADRAAQCTTSATGAATEASSNVRDIANAADELAASVMEIDRQVSQANAISEKAVGEAERSNAAVTELDAAAKRIGDVVRLITDIAEQTNLLALNATIEAARAGDAGRGFAVVAGEVKALAGQTAKATEEIAAQIAGMQQATSRSIDAIGAIEQTIRDLGAISGAIAAAVTEQGAATQEIARSVEVAAKRTFDTADEVGQVRAATGETREGATEVKVVADDLGAVASRIRGQVDEFFVRLREVSPALQAAVQAAEPLSAARARRGRS